MAAVGDRPRRAGHLPVGERHRIYFEQWGASGALPVVYLHGGPGSGCGAAARGLFDLERFAPVFVDQRGAGRSLPRAGLAHNTTAALVDDLERLRTALGIEHWLLFGGSWGATLALRYAQSYPQRVSAMLLRGVFLARPVDARWFFGAQGVARLFPREYEAFLAGLSAAERRDPPTAYAQRLAASDPARRLQAAQRWHAWEHRVLSHGLQSPGGGGDRGEGEGVASGNGGDTLVQRAAIAAHYARHGFFLGEQGALSEPERLRDIPAHIVHGALDLVCPLENAWTLHRAMPGARLEVLEDCGHAAVDPRMRAALVRALDALAERR